MTQSDGFDGWKQDRLCLACSCMCDDAAARVEQNRIVELRNVCPIGERWFLESRPETEPVCRIEGRAAALPDALRRAAHVLRAASHPAVYGLGDSPTEAQRLACALADRIGATIDTATTFGHSPSIRGFQHVGKVTCTLGEIRQRSDLVIFWGADPQGNQPRLLTRYTLEPAGRFVPGGRKERCVVAVDVRPTATTALADEFLQIQPGSDLEALWTLRALCRGIRPDAARVRAQTGVALDVWERLFERMRRARFGALLFGMGLMRTGGRHHNCEALQRLTREMQRHTRFVCRSIRLEGNVTGADKVVTWQTGFPFCVNLSRGYPRFNPNEFTTAGLLERGEIDALLVVGRAPVADLGPRAQAHLARIPVTTIAPAPGSPYEAQAQVAVRTATLGIHCGGTVYRMDEVPLLVRAVLPSSYPDDVAVLTQLLNLMDDA